MTIINVFLGLSIFTLSLSLPINIDRQFAWWTNENLKARWSKNNV